MLASLCIVGVQAKIAMSNSSFLALPRPDALSPRARVRALQPPETPFYRCLNATPRPLYLVSGRRIDRAGATDRLRPWSKETARSCKVVAPLFWQREPEQLPGPLRDKHGESPHPQGRATRPRRCHVWSLSARRLTREWTSPRSV